MTKKRKKQIAIGFAVTSIIAVVAITLWPETQASLSQRLAEKLSRNPDLISVNIPPAPGRYPGAVIVQAPNGLWLPLLQEYESDDRTTAVFEIADAVVATSNASLHGKNDFLGQALSGGIDALVSVGIKSGKVLERTIPALKKSLLDNEDVIAAYKKGLNPCVIVRAYEGVPTFRVARGRSLSSGAWTKLRKQALEAEGRLQSDDSFEFASEEPVVVGFELCEVKYIVDNFSGEANDVKLVDVPIAPLTGAAQAASVRGPITSADIRYVALGCEHYRHEKLGDLPAATASRELVESVLSMAGASPIEFDSEAMDLSADRFHTTIDDLVNKLTDDPPAATIVYLVGHAMSVGRGNIYFICSDYTGDLDLGLAPYKLAARLDRPEAPLSGTTGIEGILDVAQVLESAYPEDIPGLIGLSYLYQRMTETKTPFALLVDGCFDDQHIDQIRNEFGIADSGDYVGVKNNPTEEYEYLRKYLDAFGTAIYLRSQNVVVLGARPGSLAETVSHPCIAGGIGPEVGPLAARMTRFIQYRFATGKSTSWGDLLRGLAGEASRARLTDWGSISWSDFSWFDSVPLLRSK